jgi:TnpA family transposase
MGRPNDYLNLTPILTRPIRWELIRQQYDEMVNYATALRLSMADAETILKRFTRDNVTHPTYQALVELGKAIKTVFLCRYLHSEAMRREVHEGLNVVENWNGANDFMFYGRSGGVATTGWTIRRSPCCRCIWCRRVWWTSTRSCFSRCLTTRSGLGK